MSINPPGRWQATGRGSRFVLDELAPVPPEALERVTKLTIKHEGKSHVEAHERAWTSGSAMSPGNFTPYFNAYCIVNDTHKRGLKINTKLQDYAVNKGIVFG